MRANLFVALATVVPLLLLGYLATSTNTFSGSSLLSIGAIGLTISIIIASSIGAHGLQFSFASPVPLFGLFFFLYYPLPLFHQISFGHLSEEYASQIAAMILLGCLAWTSGMRLVRFAKSPIQEFGRLESMALLSLCGIAIGLVAYLYQWRISEGVFFTQARYYEQSPEFADALRDNVIAPLQLPLIPLLGLLAGGTHAVVSKAAKLLLFGYAGSLILILTLSSQTRLAVTAMVFLYASMNFYRLREVKVSEVLGLAGAALVAVFVTQTVRIVSSAEFALAENQLEFAITNAIPDALAGAEGHGSEIGSMVTSRGAGGLEFLADIVQRIEERGQPFYGEGVALSLYSVVPRLLWPDKPIVAPPQLVAQDLLGLPLVDAAFGPLAQFYFEGGWLGIAIGFFVFGLLLALLTRFAWQKNDLGIWIVAAFVWSHVVYLEVELIVGVLATLRNAIILYVIWAAITLGLRMGLVPNVLPK